MDISKLTLGTVQLGQAYGIANTTGQPSREDSYKILQTAYEQGLRSFDTARAYGDSETVIGEWIKEFAPSRETYRLATKLAPLPAALANVAPLAAQSLH
jgi:aryl-alcohol dehydrogenase-like predicted oxidoreductase